MGFPKQVASSSNGQSLGQGPLRKLAAGASEEYSCEFGSQKYFALCAFGGVLSCGITHTMVTPLDLVKCRLQVDRRSTRTLAMASSSPCRREASLAFSLAGLP